MSDPIPMVSFPLEQWQALTNRLRAAHENIAALEKEKNELLKSDPEGRVSQLLDTVRAALSVVQFAVGNLHPFTVRGWPYAELSQLGKLLDQMPTVTAFEKELALELQSFARECSKVELDRQREIDRLRSIKTTDFVSPVAPAVNPVTAQADDATPPPISTAP